LLSSTGGFWIIRDFEENDIAWLAYFALVDDPAVRKLFLIVGVTGFP
jgi:hypothetical protein